MRASLYAFISGVFICSPGFAASFSDQTASLAPGLQGQKVAWGDYNNDGFVDVQTNGTLWKNNGGTGFTAVGSWGQGLLWADYDNDGRLDFFDYSNRQLYRNTSTGDATSFVNVATPALPMNPSRGASWSDHNNDGYVDLYVGGYEPSSTIDQPDATLRNNAGASFTMNWQQSGNINPARGITSADFDHDGDQDIYVSNYRGEANLLWQNYGNGNYTNVAAAKGVAGTYNGSSSSYGHTIGSAWGDLDNDGYMDLFVGNFAHAAASQDRPFFYKNMGPCSGYTFEDKSSAAGLHYQESYSSPTLVDYDNDGDLDLFFTTFYRTSTVGDPNNSVLYRNNGNWQFEDVTAAAGLANISNTYQAGWADFDNDGDLDLITDAKIFVNDASDTGSNHWLKVKLTGNGTTTNSAAIGSEVRISVGGQTFTRQVEGGTGEGNQNDLTLHFGLGTHSGPVDLEVFSGGDSWVIEGVAVDSLFEYTIPITGGAGDFNGDNVVSSSDYDIMKANFFSTGNAFNTNGEVTGDGIVDLYDFKLFKEALFQGDPGTEDGTSWDVAADYSNTNNTDSTTWSYRKGYRDCNSVLSAFVEFGGVGDWDPGPPSGGWGEADNDWTNPYVIKNDTPDVQTWYESAPNIAAGSTFGSPSSTEDLILSWLSTITGFVDISGEIVFLENHAGGNGIDWFLDLNNAAGQLLGGSLFASDGTPAGTTTGPFGLSNVFVHAGDRINLVIGSQGNGTYDVVGIQFTITEKTDPLIVVGDMNGNGLIDSGDVPLFIQALTNPSEYIALYPAIDPEVVGDVNEDGRFDLGDIASFSSLYSGVANSEAVPEPTALVLALLSIAGLVIRRQQR